MKFSRVRLVLFVLCIFGAPFADAATTPGYGDLPAQFERNVGQTAEQVKFLARGRGYTLFLTDEGPVVSLSRPSSGRVALKIKMLGANRSPRIEGVDPLPGKANYFQGSDPKNWRSGIETFSRVRYRNIYPGIDVIYYGTRGELEYDIEVSPGADPRAVRMVFEGVDRKSLDTNGDLLLQLPGGAIRQRKPRVYQAISGARREVDARYILGRGGIVRFQLAGHNKSRPLTIDPVLTYATYLGGSGGGNEYGQAIAIDSAGNAYITGYTDSPDLPATSSAAQPGYRGGSYDAFVAKLNPAGTALVYLTYLGGTQQDSAMGLAVDAAGNAYVTGETNSPDFPTTRGALQGILSGPGDAFVTKLNSAGSALVYSTYLGGSSNDAANGIRIDSSGSVFVTGYTESPDFPTTAGTLQPWSPGPGIDAFVVKLNPMGSGIVYSTYLGGSGYDIGCGIAVDGGGNAFVAGYTSSADFPVTDAAVYAGGYDFFVTKLNPAGTAAGYSTLLGGSEYDVAQAIDVDGSGNATVAGYTYSADFPTTQGAQQPTFGGAADAVIARLDASGTRTYSSYLGGPGSDYAYSVAVDANKNAYLAGYTSGGFPTTTLAYMPGGWGAFLAKLDLSGTLAYSTYLSYSDSLAYGVAVDGTGSALVTGYTSSPIFPTTPGAVQTTLGGYADVFVARLKPSGSGVEYSTYLGRNGGDAGYSIAADASGNAYIWGETGTIDFPTVPGSFQTGRAGSTDVFITKLNSAGTEAIYSTYLGGSGTDARGGQGVGIAVDAAGNAYVTGHTYSPDFPVTAGAYQTAMGSNEDAFITKLNSAGNGLVYSTYLGGDSIDVGSGIAVDSSGSAYVTGWTWSSAFPNSGGEPNHGRADAFVVKVNPDGAALNYSYLVGGSGTEVGNALGIDSQGNAYITGWTESLDFPVTPGAFQSSHGGGAPSPPHAPQGYDGYVAKVNAAGNGLSYATYLGGSGTEQMYGLAVDSSGSAYVSGYTSSANFPVTPGSLRTSLGGGQDAFITKLNPDGSGLVYSTYLGGSNSEIGIGLAVDGAGNAHVAGTTWSADFPISADAVQRGLGGGRYMDAFLTKINSAGTAVLYSTYFGGTAGENGRGVAVDPSGNMYLTGSTNSTDLPTTVGAFQEAFGGFGGSDAFVVKIGGAAGACNYALSSAGDSFRSVGGSGTIAVLTKSGCNWIASSQVNWLSFNAPSGSGGGAVQYTVAENFNTSPRTGTATIAGQLFTINQAGAACSYSMEPRRESFGPAGGLGMIEVTAPYGCEWTAVSSAAWLIIRGVNSGNGSYTVRYTVSVNSGKRRTATITLGGQEFRVTQAGAP